MQGLGAPTLHTVRNLLLTLWLALHICGSASMDSTNCRCVVCIYWGKKTHISGPAQFKPSVVQGSTVVSTGFRKWLNVIRKGETGVRFLAWVTRWMVMALIEIWGGKVVYIWMVVLEMFFIHICSSEFSIFFATTIYYFWNESKQRVVLFVL